MSQAARATRIKAQVVEPPPRDSRFGSPLQVSRVHRVKTELVVDVAYLTWIEDNLLRQVSYKAQREDKPATEVVRPMPIRPNSKATRRDDV